MSRKGSRWNKTLVLTCSGCRLIRYFDEIELAQKLAQDHENRYEDYKHHKVTIDPNLPPTWGQ